MSGETQNYQFMVGPDGKPRALTDDERKRYVESCVGHSCEPAWAAEDANAEDCGPAVEYCYEKNEGELWVGNGEYASRVNYCPYCGKPADKRVEG